MKMDRSLARFWLIVVSLLMVSFITVITFAGYFLAGPTGYSPGLLENARAKGETPSPDLSSEEHLQVMTLNLFHGRGGDDFRVFVSKGQIFENLKAVAGLIRSTSPHIVALQEVDESSILSGGFNHVQQLMLDTGLPYGSIGRHVTVSGMAYGTGFVSRLPLTGIHSRTFDPRPPTLTKGFVIASVPWPGRSSVMVDIVSVHLDFLSTSNRKRQAKDLEDYLYRRDNPLVVMGDFNSTWDEPDSAVRSLARRLNLKAYNPDTDHTPTFPGTGKRIDWILISADLAFTDYAVRPEAVSDHFAITANLKRGK